MSNCYKAHIHCVSKNKLTLASCSFDKHGLILDKQHQHTFRNYMHTRLYAALPRHDAPRRLCRGLARPWPTASCGPWLARWLCRGHVPTTINIEILLSLSLHFYLLLNSCDGNDTTPVTWSSASLNMGKRITKCHWRSCWSMEIEQLHACISASVSFKCLCIFRPKGVIQIRYYYYYYKCERTSCWTSAKMKLALFRAANSLAESTEENALCVELFPSQLFKSLKLS